MKRALTLRMPDRSVAFLDILGFKSFTLFKPAGASQLLADYNQIINTKLADMEQFPAEGYEQPELARLALIGEAGSFETFLPCSDSIFIISNQPDLLIQQISRFLLDSFTLTSDAFAHPENPADPTIITITELSLQGVVRRTISRWFPLLFRGGVAFGEVMTQRVTTIVEGVRSTNINLTGPAVVNAVGLEKTGRGPRLFCAPEFRNRLNAQSRELLAKLPKSQDYELLWPALLYNDANSPHIEINHFIDLFLPAANLWRFYRDEPNVAPQYLEFLRLIIKATLIWFRLKNSPELARNHIKEKISRFGLVDVEDILFPESLGHAYGSD